jgi:hypothetical protein
MGAAGSGFASRSKVWPRRRKAGLEVVGSRRQGPMNSRTATSNEWPCDGWDLGRAGPPGQRAAPRMGAECEGTVGPTKVFALKPTGRCSAPPHQPDPTAPDAICGEEQAQRPASDGRRSDVLHGRHRSDSSPYPFSESKAVQHLPQRRRRPLRFAERAKRELPRMISTGQPNDAAALHGQCRRPGRDSNPPGQCDPP